MQSQSSERAAELRMALGRDRRRCSSWGLDIDTCTIEWLGGRGHGAWLVTSASGGSLVATRAGAQEIAAAQAAADGDMGPQVIGAVDGWLLCRHLSGARVSLPEMRRPGVLVAVASLLARLHRSDVPLAPASLRDVLRASPVAASVGVRGDVERCVEWALETVGELEDRAGPRVPCHLDVAANLLSGPHGLRLIDFEYAASAPPVQELGQLVWEAELDAVSAGELVEAYLARSETDVDVAHWATWSLVVGVAWTQWAWAHPRPGMARYARRSWERLRVHWAWGESGPCG